MQKNCNSLPFAIGEGILEREGTQVESDTGVRVTMLGAPGTRIYVGEGPLVDAPPHHRLDGHAEPSVPLALVRRKAKAATYAAVHEPYSDQPSARSGQQVWSSPTSLTFLGEGRLNYEFREDRIVIKYLNPSRADREQTVWLGNFDVLQAPVHNGTQRVPHEPVVAEWLFFPHPVYRQGVLLRFAKRTPVTLNLPTLYPQAVGQAAVHFPMRSGEEVSLSFATREEIPR